MKRKRMSRDEIIRIAEELGIPSAPPDHPIYSEGPSITFLSRTQKQPMKKAIDSSPSAPENDSDFPKKK